MTFGHGDPENQVADAVRVGAVGTVEQSCAVCKEWKRYKGVVPQFSKDGSIYFIDRCERGTPGSTTPQKLSGSTAIKPASTAALTPASCQQCPSEDWCDLEDLGWQAVADRCRRN